MRLDVSIKHQELEKSARRTDRARDGSRRQPCTRKTRDPFPQVRPRELGNLFAVRVGPRLKSTEIALVAFERMTRQTLLDLDVG